MGVISPEAWENRWKIATELPNHRWVSTVDLIIEHPGGHYETMVFRRGEWVELDVERYETQAEAEKGHKRMVAKWSKKGGRKR